MPQIKTEVLLVNNCAPVELTAQQRAQWGETMSLMSWTCPGFQHIFYKLLVNHKGNYAVLATRDIETAATDGQNIVVNPDWFFAQDLRERVFVTAHEVMHCVYDDPGLMWRQRNRTHITMNDGTELPWDRDIANKAMDYRINAMLVESRIGRLPRCGGWFDLKVADGKAAFLDVYKKVYEQTPPGGGKGNNALGQGQGKGSFDQLMDPGASTGQNPAQAAQARNPGQWAVEIANARQMEAQRAQGKLPGSMLHMFQTLLEPEVSWVDHIAAQFRRRVGSGSYDWRRPDRRFIVRDIYVPGRSGHGAGWIVVWADTSGSISTHELNSYLPELSGILEECRPRRLTVIWADASIQRIDELEEPSDIQDVIYKGAPGRGGTSIHPVMKWIADHYEPPDMFLGFTDGEFDFPVEPAFPVVWASVREHKYPYGEMVRINQRATKQ